MHTVMGTRPIEPLEIPVSAADDEAMEAALADLDAKLSAWSEALLSAREAQAREQAARVESVAQSTRATRPPTAGQSSGVSRGRAPADKAASRSAVSRSPGQDSGPSVSAATGGAVDPPVSSSDNGFTQGQGSLGDGEIDFLAMAWPGTVAEEDADSGPASGDAGVPAPAGASQSAAPTTSVGGGTSSSSTGVLRERAGRKRSAVLKARRRVEPEVENQSEVGQHEADVTDQGVGVPDNALAKDRAAQELSEQEDLLADMDEEVVKRVRIARRFDPSADLKELIEKTQAKASPDRTEKGTWWRRKRK